MNRIRSKFEELKGLGRKALIPYITPEFPVKGVTVPLLKALEQSGADLIEIGIPFSDPLADGKTIQQSSELALRHGVTIPLILDFVGQFRASSQIPLLLMGYMNPILRYGVAKFVDDATKAGVDGLIIPDLPPEEADEMRTKCIKSNLSNVFLIAPTSSPDRIKMIDNHSADFSYCVSVTGVTGARAELGADGTLDSFLRLVKENTAKPYVVGFGVSNAAQVQRVSSLADGVVVGSALLQAIQSAKTVDAAVKAASTFLTSLRS
jgi:tryptophan synthase alpha chain